VWGVSVWLRGKGGGGGGGVGGRGGGGGGGGGWVPAGAVVTVTNGVKAYMCSKCQCPLTLTQLSVGQGINVQQMPCCDSYPNTV